MLKRLLILLLTFMAHINGNDRPVMITFYTPSHISLYNKYFLPSFNQSKLSKYYQLHTAKFPQECDQASYMTSGWNSTMMRKVDLILETIKAHYDEIFVYADVDIQFFKGFNATTFLKDYDIVFQRNQSKNKRVCAGFFIAKANEAVYNLWQSVKEQMMANPKLDDQEPLNRALRDRNLRNPNLNLNIKWGLLPNSFFNPALYTGAVRWVPGMELVLPAKIILHHANWTVGLENKIQQLDYVQSLLNS
jgi:hypothetical protein